MTDKLESQEARGTAAPRVYLWVVGSLAISLAAIAVAVVGVVRSHSTIEDLRQELDSRTDQLAWSAEVHSAYHDRNSITPQVGIIQFLERGFSVRLEKVNYSATGLELAGFIGNPTSLWVTQLTLEFRAYRPLHTKRHEFMVEDPDNRWFFLPDSIGHAQASPIAILGPGHQQPFQVTIPNVTQSQTESFELVVSFSGERYSYDL